MRELGAARNDEVIETRVEDSLRAVKLLTVA